MKVPLEISYRNIAKDNSTELLIRNKVRKLERIHNDIISCHAVVEMPQKDVKGGSPYRVRISLRIPHSPEIVVSREPGEGSGREKLDAVIRDSFEKMSRQLKSATELKRKEIKFHSLQKHRLSA